jgi:hypothetical protein
MLAAAESPPWDDTEHLRDQLVIEADASHVRSPHAANR